MEEKIYRLISFKSQLTAHRNTVSSREKCKYPINATYLFSLIKKCYRSLNLQANLKAFTLVTALPTR